ncbi:hypothetical protein ACVNS2_17010 [Paenibacillus caseinilyticus]|uniref:hypothetical protein n=1 Tax=Paenibacillus mucilaginosus TaxID=61624 RepID=UPI0030C780A2
MTDLERSISWYSRLLGLDVREGRHEGHRSIPWIWGRDVQALRWIITVLKIMFLRRPTSRCSI